MSEIIIYENDEGRGEVQVRLDDETVWLTQKQMAELFGKDVRTINEHIRNIFKESELEEKSVIRKFRITATDGKTYESSHYNLDVIISVGYRIHSKRGVRFRQWATGALESATAKDYSVVMSMKSAGGLLMNDLHQNDIMRQYLVQACGGK